MGGGLQVTRSLGKLPLLLLMLLLLLPVGRCDHWRCTGGADKGRLLLVLHSRMLWRLLKRLLMRYLLLLLELPEADYHSEGLLHERHPEVL